MALYILVECQNIVVWRLVLKYMQSPPTHFLESSGRATYMEIHPSSRFETIIIMYFSPISLFASRTLK